MNGPSVLGLGNGQVLIRGLAVLDVARAVSAALDVAQRRDALTPPARLLELRRVLDLEARAVLSGWPTTDGRNGAAQASSGEVAVRHTLSTAEAAIMLDRSERQVRRLARLLGGRRIAGRWLLDRDAVSAAATERG